MGRSNIPTGRTGGGVGRDKPRRARTVPCMGFPHCAQNVIASCAAGLFNSCGAPVTRPTSSHGHLRVTAFACSSERRGSSAAGKAGPSRGTRGCGMSGGGYAELSDEDRRWAANSHDEVSVCRAHAARQCADRRQTADRRPAAAATVIRWSQGACSWRGAARRVEVRRCRGSGAGSSCAEPPLLPSSPGCLDACRKSCTGDRAGFSSCG